MKGYNLIILLWWLQLLLHTPVKGQSSAPAILRPANHEYLIHTQNITSEDGLAHMQTQAVFKNSAGFLWVGTKYGLNRYDGYHFKLYNKEKNGLSHNQRIWRIEEDQDGKLWLFYVSKGWPQLGHAVFVGIDIFDPVTEKVIPVQDYLEEALPFAIEDIVFTTINTDHPSGLIWLATKNGGLFYYTNGRFESFRTKPFEQIHCLNIHKGQVWVSGAKTLACFDLEGNALAKFEFTEDINNIWFANNDRVLVHTQNTSGDLRSSYLWEKPDTSDRFLPLHFKDNQELLNNSAKSFEIIQYHQRGLWFYFSKPLEGGIITAYILNETGQIVHALNAGFANEIRRLYFGFFEEDNMAWITTAGQLLKVEISGNRFQLIHSRAEGSRCRSLFEDQHGDIYFTNNAIYRYRPEQQAIEPITEDIMAFHFVFADSLLWSSSLSGKFSKVEINLNRKEQTTFPVAEYPIRAYCFLKTGPTGRYLAGSQSGLHYFNVQTGAYTPFSGYNEYEELYSTLLKS